MMTNKTLVAGIPSMDVFAFGTLNEALDELNILNAKMNPKHESVNGQRQRVDAKGLSCQNSFRQWRNPSLIGTGIATTKENLEAAGSGGTYFDYVSGNNPQVRPHRTRVNPYYHRKPLYSLWGRSRSLQGYDLMSNLLHDCHRGNSGFCFRSLRSVNSLPRLYETERKGITELDTLNLQKPRELFEDPVLKPKTEFCAYPLPVPVLTRSKSLEDLRESVKPKLKSLSTDMTSGSFEASSLSPRRSIPGKNCRLGGNSAFPMTLYPRRIFDPPLKDVDSMSLQIGKLNVS